MRIRDPFALKALAHFERAISRDDLQPGRLSYQHFLKYFADRPRLSEHEFIIGANFVYGWMRTSLKIDTGSLDAAVDALAAARRAKPLDGEALEVLKRAVNRSVVGTSKLLHFVNPRVYPIWDRNVSTVVSLGPVDSVPAYRGYLKKCREAVRRSGFRKLHRSINRKLGYRVGRLRAVELILWVEGKRRRRGT